MGNFPEIAQDEHVECKETDQNTSSKLKLFQCSIFHKKKPSQKYVNPPNDKFIIEYTTKNKERLQNIDNNYMLSMDNRRHVFVSLIGLYKTWKQCPSHVLHSSIFILPLKRKWLYNLLEYQNEIIGCDFISQHHIFQQDLEEAQEFIQMLKWKDGKKLVFWMMDKDETDLNNENTVFAESWINLSDKITKMGYNPIIFDETFWKHQFGGVLNPKYEDNVANILCELWFLSKMNYKAIQEIIYQSNPTSLNPIISYVNDTNTTHFFENVGNGWFIADDYE